MKRNSLAIFPLFFVALLIVSCATTSVPVTRQKPSDFDLTGIKKIAILPVNFPKDVGESPVQDGIAKCASDYRWKIPAEHEISTYLITKLTNYLDKNSSYIIVDNSEIAKCIPIDEKAEAAKNATFGKKLENAAKAIFSSGEEKPAQVLLDSTTIVNAYVIFSITTMSSTHESVFGIGKNSAGKDESITTETKVLTFDYKMDIYRSSDSTLIGEKTESKVITTVETGPDAFFNVKTDKTLAIEAIDATFTDIVHAFLPYSVDETLVLEKDTNKNSDMKAADKLANKQKYAEALALYSKIYTATNSFAAGYNAALMTELSGDLPGAIAAMDALSQASGNPKAATELKRMQQTLSDQSRLNINK